MRDQPMYRAGERFKLMRQLFEITQDRFAELTEIPYNRLANIETLRVRMSEDDFFRTCNAFPEFTPWLVHEGKINIDQLKKSTDPMINKAGVKLSVGLFPKGYEELQSHLE